MNSLRVQFDSDASHIILIPYIGSSAVTASFLHYIGFKSCNLTARKNKTKKGMFAIITVSITRTRNVVVTS